jgi:hypothetical protein
MASETLDRLRTVMMAIPPDRSFVDNENVASGSAVVASGAFATY